MEHMPMVLTSVPDGGCAPKICTSCARTTRDASGPLRAAAVAASGGTSDDGSGDPSAPKSVYPSAKPVAIPPNAGEAKADRELNIPAARILMKNMYGGASGPPRFAAGCVCLGENAHEVG